MLPYIIGIVVSLSLAGAFFYLYYSELQKTKNLSKSRNSQSKEIEGKLFETELMDELHKRVGYSINTRGVLDTIVSSFPDFLQFSAASYVLLEGSKIYYKSHLEESVSKKFIEKTKDSLLEILKNSNPNVIGSESIEDEITGSLLNSSNAQDVKSSFNVTLTVDGETLGVLNVASTKANIYKKTDIALISRIVERAMNEITQLQALLNHEKSKLEAMVENMRDGIVMIDEDFRILSINPACLSMVGKNTPDNISIFDIVGYFSKAFPLAEMIAEVFETGLSKSVSDLKYNSKFYDVLVIPVKTGKKTDAVGIIVHDKTKEHELIALREDFTSMLVHELRAPLTVILDTADLMLKRSSELSSEQTTNLLNQIQNSTGSLLAIVNDLLDTAKLEAGKMEVIKRSDSINNLLKDQVNYFTHLAQKKGISIRSELDTELPDVKFDETKVKQVMNNLLSNAIKFTDKGEVVVRSQKLSDFVKIEVCDTGPGISAQDKEKLFNKFEQVSRSLSSEEKGTGLGLVITKGIVEAHGGKINIEDNKPQGTKLVFTLPIE